jgi:hypothetical protein
METIKDLYRTPTAVPLELHWMRHQRQCENPLALDDCTPAPKSRRDGKRDCASLTRYIPSFVCRQTIVTRPLLASQEENEWPREGHTNPFAQPERTGIVGVHQQGQDQPGAKVEPSRRATAPDRHAQAIFHRHQPRRPAPATF